MAIINAEVMVQHLAAHYHQIILCLVLCIVVSVYGIINVSKKNNINFSDLFLDDKTGKIGGSQFRVNTAFIISAIGLIYLLLTNDLTEYYYSIFIGAFVLDRAISRGSEILNGKTSTGNQDAGAGAGSGSSTGGSSQGVN